MTTKKLMPLFAIVIAVVLAGITSGFKEPRSDLFAFQYSPPSSDPSPYSEANVKDTGNWIFTTTPAGCNDKDEEACLLQVTEDYVDLSGPQPRLESSINIETDVELENGTHFVISIDDMNGEFTNRSH